MAVAEDFEDRFRKHLPRSNDLTLVILKGHLLMEESVIILLDSMLPNPKALNRANPKLSHRLCLLRALHPVGQFDSIFNAAEKLNILRNKLAHHLDHPQVENLTNEFLRELEDQSERGELDKEPVGRRLKRCIALLCGQLHGFAAMRKEMVSRSRR